MPAPVPIDRRLSETKPSTVSEALLISVVNKHKRGLAPSLPTSAMKRIERTLGEHPSRLRPLPVWRVLRTVAVVLAALVSVQAIAVVGIRLVEVVKVHLAQKKAGQVAETAHGPLHGSKVTTALPPALAAPLPRVTPADPAASGSALPGPTTLPHVLAPPARRLDQSVESSAPTVSGRPSIVTPPAPMVAVPSGAGYPSAQSRGTSATQLHDDLPPPPVVFSSPVAGGVAVASSPNHAGTLNSFDKGHPVPSTAQPTERPSPGPDPLDVEAAQLKHGLELKRAGDLVSAVATFKHYRQTHPRGAFWVEASLAELDAQLSLGHREEALSILQEVGDDPALPRSAELRLLRAELAARRGRCPEALAGFAASLQIPSLAERALYGQASCQQAQGRFSESRRTFEEYLSRYPQGSLATEARRALGSSD